MHIAYVVVNFDDPLHEYAARWRMNIDEDLATSPPADVEVALDIKPIIHAATSVP
jgi:hypothetical protein